MFGSVSGLPGKKLTLQLGIVGADGDAPSVQLVPSTKTPPPVLAKLTVPVGATGGGEPPSPTVATHSSVEVAKK
jgi:hypothetical protein